MRDYRLLLIDDEVNALKALQRGLQDEGYEVKMATSAREALQMLKHYNPHLIIADLVMPEMSGVEFFQACKKLQPGAVRILLTGKADLESAISAINEGEVYRLITKPWDNEELEATVRMALEHYEGQAASETPQAKAEQGEPVDDLKERYPGITEISRASDGSIIVEDVDDEELKTLLESFQKP